MREDSVDDLAVLQRADGWADQHAHPCPAFLLFLEQLIVVWATAEARGENLLDQLLQGCAEERHALARELLVAADRVQMAGEPGSVEGAAAVALDEDRVVAALDVDHQLRRDRAEAGEVERADLRAPRQLAGALDGRDARSEQVRVVRLLRVGARHSDRADLRHAVGGHRACADRLDERGLRRRVRLPAEDEERLRDVEPVVERGAAYADCRAGRAHQRGRRARCPRPGQPARDHDGVSRRNVPGEREPGRAEPGP